MTYKEKLKAALSEIPEELLAYNEDEYWMYSYVYDYLSYYARSKELLNTAVALRVSRALHNGKYRKSVISRDGNDYRLPYIIHPLLVTRMLADLNLPVLAEDEDILLASALCHDTIEDVEFENGGRELYEIYGLDKRVYENVKAVSKRYDFTEQEEKDFFHNIESSWITLLVKLCDRGQNVEDMYNMSLWKIHEYIDETVKFFLPMCKYGLEYYPHLFHPITILQDKINLLTSISAYLADSFDERIRSLKEDIEVLSRENEMLKNSWLENEDE